MPCLLTWGIWAHNKSVASSKFSNLSYLAAVTAKVASPSYVPSVIKGALQGLSDEWQSITNFLQWCNNFKTAFAGAKLSLITIIRFANSERKKTSLSMYSVNKDLVHCFWSHVSRSFIVVWRKDRGIIESTLASNDNKQKTDAYALICFVSKFNSSIIPLYASTESVGSNILKFGIVSG